jgi:hypothetical protein
MKLRQRATLNIVAGTLLAACACSSLRTAPADTPAMAVQRRELAKALIGQWSEDSALAARLMMDEYGTPDEVLYERLVWNKKGPWRRSVVQNVRPFYTADHDLAIIEQTIGYELTPSQASDVAAGLGERVRYDARSRELSARSDREELNYLGLNLAHDVVLGTLRPERARDSYELIISLEAAGKSSPYLLGLRFKTMR